MSEMNVEQFRELSETLPEGADKRRVAKELGLTLPLDMQLEDVRVTDDKKAGRVVSIPSLELDDGSQVGRRTIDARVARQVAQRVLEVCDTAEL